MKIIERSSDSSTAPGKAWVKEGQPVPLLNLAEELNNLDPHPAQQNTPGLYSLFRGLEKGLSVPARRSTWKLSGAKRFLHSSSERFAQSSPATAAQEDIFARVIDATSACKANRRLPDASILGPLVYLAEVEACGRDSVLSCLCPLVAKPTFGIFMAPIAIIVDQKIARITSPTFEFNTRLSKFMVIAIATNSWKKPTGAILLKPPKFVHWLQPMQLQPVGQLINRFGRSPDAKMKFQDRRVVYNAKTGNTITYVSVSLYLVLANSGVCLLPS